MDKQIKLLVSDFDGVMTDNRVLVDENGKESVFVNRSDGLAVGILRKRGIKTIVLSTETNGVVSARARKSNIECLQSVCDKAAALKEYCVNNGFDLENVAYIGNDINDLEVMKLVGTKIVPADAYEEVKSIADIITKAKGGCGVIREVVDIFLK